MNESLLVRIANNTKICISTAFIAGAIASTPFDTQPAYSQHVIVQQQHAERLYQEALLKVQGSRSLEPTTLKRIVDSIPQSPQVHFLYANAIMRLVGWEEESMRSYNRAIELKPDFPEAFLNRGVCRFFTQKAIYDRAYGHSLDEIIADFDKAIELNKFLFSAYFNKGAVLSDLKGSIYSIQWYERAATIGHMQDSYRLPRSIENEHKTQYLGYEPTMFISTHCQFEAENWMAERGWYNMIPNKGSVMAELFYRLGTAYDIWPTNDSLKAIQAYTKGLQYNPTMYSLYEARARTCYRMGKKAEYERDMEESRRAALAVEKFRYDVRDIVRKKQTP